MDPIEVFRQQCKVFLDLTLGQLNTLIDNACDQMIARNRQLLSLPKLPQEAPAWTTPSYASLWAQPPPPPPTQVPKEKEEFYDDDDIIVDASPPAKPSSKRALFQDDEEEHSAELIDSSSSSSGDDFINDEEEPSVASSEEEENSSSIPPPPPLHRSLIPAAAVSNNKRARTAPRRFSPSRVEEAKKADTKAERSGIELGGRRKTKADQEQWQRLRQEPLGVQDRNSWFCGRYGNQLDAFRSGLGNETENNHGPRVLWDTIGSVPEQFDFRSCFNRNTECAFCGAKRTCTWKVTQKVTGNLYYMGVCCALLAKAWKAFQEARSTETRVEEMDRLFGEVQDAHIAKGNYRGRKKWTKTRCSKSTIVQNCLNYPILRKIRIAWIG
jgi:hypothetical protein